MWVKICANTNRDDALHAVQSGADAVGFVFAPSSRQVTAATVKESVSGLSATVERVGVFTSTDASDIAAIATEADLSAVQLHGAHDPAFLAELASLLGPGTAIVPVVHWQIDDPAASDTVSRRLDDLESAGFKLVLIDAKLGTKSGGLGVAFDWSSATGVFDSHRHLQLILAGGLTPANVAEAIRTLKPWGVDVASGVEQQPGRKDHVLVESFVQNAKALS